MNANPRMAVRCRPRTDSPGRLEPNVNSLVLGALREEGSSSPLRRGAQAESGPGAFDLGLGDRTRQATTTKDEEDEYAALAEKYGVQFDDDDESGNQD